MRTSNPALGDKTFESLSYSPDRSGSVMTLNGTVNKTAILLALVIAAAAWTWSQTLLPGGDRSLTGALALLGVFGGFIVALVTTFKPAWSPVTAPIYAVLEGLFLGAISAVMNQRYPGIVPQAVALTFGTLFCLLAAYRSGLIPVTDNFRLGIVAATGGIALIYLATILLGLFNVSIPFIHDAGIIGIGFSVFVVIIAALNLVLDFDFIEQGVSRGAPKYMEWYGGFGLLVTLVWLYLEILRLLSKLSRR